MAVKSFKVMVEFAARVGYVLPMDTVKTMNKSGPALSTMKTKTGLVNRGKKIGVQDVSLAVRSLSRSGMHALSRFTRRGSWLSYQYFELGSLINLYLMALEAKDARTSKTRFELFVHTALRVLRGYKASVYRRFKRSVSKGKKTIPSPLSLHGAVTTVYEELRTVARMHERKHRWKQVIDTAGSLIREALGR
jgi:hypothetical protein